MNDKQIVQVAGMIQEVLLKLRKSRYVECMQRLSLFMSKVQSVTHDSRRLALSLSRDWFAAAERCCKGIGRQLNEIPYAVCTAENILNRRDVKVPNLSVIAEEIRALRDEFGDVEFNWDEEALCAVTEPITLEEVYLGRFRIALYIERLGELYHQVPYFVMAIDPHPAATDEAVTHPHVSNEQVCEGDGGAAIRAALEAGRLTDFFTLVRSILTTYNPESPYVPLADWHGTPCYECGYVMDSENSYYCTYCENAVCDECSAVCESCAEVVCKSCACACEICERSLCPHCAKTKCSQCESVCCASCLDDGLCPDCKEERDNDEEQETDDDKQNAAKKEETTLGGRLAERGERTGATDAAVQPDSVGQAPVLSRPLGQ